MEDEIIPMALQILQKKALPSTVFVKHQLITPRNVDLIYPLDDRQDTRVGFTSGHEQRVESAKRN